MISLLLPVQIKFPSKSILIGKFGNLLDTLIATGSVFGIFAEKLQYIKMFQRKSFCVKTKKFKFGNCYHNDLLLIL